ncbi:MAG: D-alanine--D-alanine ligase [Candidatus Omnitrophica bacterium]|nr:D-alanine--D-alanine ligase [Candidatus Omnitrophota bacterium]MDD5670439.1 D-alanine--D-alanine ligase [Candidatus Omnitrophota bacterium]
MRQKFYSNLKFGLSNNIKVGVFCGGRSSERKISLRSGRAVRDALKRVGIWTIMVDPANRAAFQKKCRRIDVAFLALHGQGGEDGVIQRTLEQKRIPYIGSDASASMRAFDKKIAKRCFVRNGISTPPYIELRLSDWKNKIKDMSVPAFVKPARNGSSVGVFKVDDLKTSIRKVKQAIAVHGDLIAEKQIEGREFTVGVLGRQALPVIELRPKRDFYDYRAKYTRGMTEYLVPAPIDGKLAAKLQRIALKVHRVLGLRDFSRIDLMVDRVGHAYVLEANSIPGLTELSLLPKAARACGISFEQLCCRLISWAYRRGANTRGK